eukprot:TRINITY_DN1304_c0_g1_i1.p1 TRINITY_DN1304_c0_g1~~TRINITY_DN1304_c0_g1_i1.p1  ORF type:complete len:359 (+),score=38.10 TRINITY_DN1304_c0_g1_i1:290-1366(+)
MENRAQFFWTQLLRCVPLNPVQVTASHSLQPTGAIESTYEALESAFPFCSDLKERGNGRFHGHLTVAQFKDTKTAKAMISTWSKAWRPVIWDVTSVCFIARRGESAFSVKHTLALGTSKDADDIRFSKDDADSRFYVPGQAMEHELRVETVEEIGSDAPVSVEKSDSTEVARRDEPKLISRAIPSSRNPSIAWPDGEVGTALTRIDAWLTTMAVQHRDKLPKTRTKLLAAIKKLCIVRQKPLTGQLVCLRLAEEKLIAIHGDSVEYLQKDSDSKPLPKFEDNPYGWRMTAEEKILARCRAWVRNPSNVPKSKDTLERSLDQLSELKTGLDDAVVVAMLAGLDICHILDDREETVQYNL